MAQLTWADGRETWYRVVVELTPGSGPTAFHSPSTEPVCYGQHDIRATLLPIRQFIKEPA